MYGDNNQMPPPIDQNGGQGNGAYYYNEDEYGHPAATEEAYPHDNHTNHSNVIYEDEEDYAYDGTVGHNPNYNAGENNYINAPQMNHPAMNPHDHDIYSQPQQHQEQYQQHPHQYQGAPPPPMMNAPPQTNIQQYQQPQSQPPPPEYLPKSQSKDRERAKKHRDNKMSSSSSRASRSHRKSGHEDKKNKKNSPNSKKDRKDRQSTSDTRSKSYRDDKSISTKKSRQKLETTYEADFEEGKKGKRKKKMSFVKKIAISGTVIVVFAVIAVAALIFSRSGGNTKGNENGNGNGVVSQPSTSTVNIPVPAPSTDRPTKWPTMLPTIDVPSSAPNIALKSPSEPVLCPTVQEMIGACVGQNGAATDDLISTPTNNNNNNNNNNGNAVPAPSPPVPSPSSSSSSRTQSPVMMTPTVSTQNNGIDAPCPTIQFILGTCGTRSPTLPPQTRSPVVQVPPEKVCMREKYQNKIFINEFHYKNQAFDFAEFIELAHSTDLNLSGYVIEFYDGISGQVYKRTELGNTIPAVTSSDPNGGSVTFSAYSQVGFHDGPAGVALVDPNGNILEFIGYGDPSVSNVAFTAVNGFASGMTPSNIGVFEPEDSSMTASLQLSGIGSESMDFQWQEPDFGTPGKVNEGQVFICE